MALAKKEAAQLLIDAMTSEKKLKVRLTFEKFTPLRKKKEWWSMLEQKSALINHIYITHFQVQSFILIFAKTSENLSLKGYLTSQTSAKKIKKLT